MNIQHDDENSNTHANDLDIAGTGDGLENLILAAFDKAKNSGKEDWDSMTVAVLKNRLLELTQRQFTETDYGARSIVDLVYKLNHLLELDESVKPPIVRLRRKEYKEGGRLHLPGRIRRDLWNAVVDYRRGEAYVWAGFGAVPQSEYVGAGQPKILPTLSVEEESDWRESFIQSIANDLTEQDLERARRWRQERLGVRELPESLQKPWNSYFKAHVIDRLKEWFTDQDIAAPDDLLVAAPKPMSRPADSGHTLRELRALVIRCVQHMTLEELSELRLPPQAVLRSQR